MSPELGYCYKVGLTYTVQDIEVAEIVKDVFEGM